MTVNLGRLVSADPNHAIFFELNRENIAAYLKSTQDQINKLFDSHKVPLTDEEAVMQMGREFVFQLRDSREIEKWIPFSPETENFKPNVEATIMDLFEKIYNQRLT